METRWGRDAAWRGGAGRLLPIPLNLPSMRHSAGRSPGRTSAPRRRACSSLHRLLCRLLLLLLLLPLLLLLLPLLLLLVLLLLQVAAAALRLSLPCLVPSPAVLNPAVGTPNGVAWKNIGVAVGLGVAVGSAGSSPDWPFSSTPWDHK